MFAAKLIVCSRTAHAIPQITPIGGPLTVTGLTERSMPVDRELQTSSVRLHWVDWGGSGTPLLLLHATGFHARVWDPYVPHPRDSFRVIALDQRGHGTPACPPKATASGGIDSPKTSATSSRGPAFARWRPEFLTLYANHGLRRRHDGLFELKCAPEVEAAVYEGNAQQDPWPAVAKIDAPVMLLRATAITFGASPWPSDVAQRIPGCRGVPVAASHFIPMEAPEIVADTMDAVFG